MMASERRRESARVASGRQCARVSRLLPAVGCSSWWRARGARRGAGAADLALSRLAVRGRDDNARYFQHDVVSSTIAVVTVANAAAKSRKTPETEARPVLNCKRDVAGGAIHSSCVSVGMSR